MSDYSELYDHIGYVFKDEKLLLRALTHTSFDAREHYQRLEFLGDSIVDYAVSDLLYHSSNESEGKMSKTRASMVSEKPLSDLSDLLGLSQMCRKRNCPLSQKMKSDLYEALTAAIALDGGLEKAVEFVKRTIRLAPPAPTDYKSEFKEYCEKKGLRYKPEFFPSGKDNRKIFNVTISVDGKIYGTGIGKSKKSAENEACRIALKRLKCL